MAQKSGFQQVTEALAEATGRTDEELRLALTVAGVVVGLIAALRLLKFLGDLGVNVAGHS